MDYLVKDLTRMTGVPAHTIRKWQERYHILRPRQTLNGYWHYSNEDYFVLKSIQQRLKNAERLKDIMALGRDNLLKDRVGEFSEEQMRFLGRLRKGEFAAIEEEFERRHSSSTSSWINRVVRPFVVLVGKAWESQQISVAEEHAFSRWITAYLTRKAQVPAQTKRTGWFVTTFPEDPHELSALLYYSILKSRGIPAQFYGQLPREELFKEIRSGEFKGVTVSVVLKQPRAKLESLRAELQKTSPGIQVRFGGFALRGEFNKESRQTRIGGGL
jgi:DNA-binding transcriptional MerR regulator